MATGENSGTWGNVTNTNLGTAIEQALVETATVTFASANVTLTLTDSNSAQNARALRLNLTGTTAGARDLIVPAIQKPYLVNNGTADTITVKVSGQTGVAVPASTSMLLYNNGTDVGLAFNRVVANVVGNVTGNLTGNVTGNLAGNVTGNLTGTASNATVLQTARTIAISGGVTGTATSFNGSANITIDATAINVGAATAGTLAVGRGGTGATTLTNNSVIIGNTTSAVKFVAPGTAGNVLTSNGSAWSSAAAAAFDSGTVMLFAQTAAPTGWTKNTSTGNQHALRIVTGTASSGGSVDFTTAFASKTPTGSVSISSVSGSAGATTLSIPTIPAHDHPTFVFNDPSPAIQPLQGNYQVNGPSRASPSPIHRVSPQGGGGSHTHPFSFSSGSGTFSGNAINLAVKYVDVIRATKN
jgi:hypothetical protein